MTASPFVRGDFEAPRGLVSEGIRLEPLGPQHNEADYTAWSMSIAHIRSTPGFESRSWPHEMSLAENLGDLEAHAQEFDERRGFTYTVLDAGDGDVIGCVYITPADDHEHDASVSSWVRADRADLDEPLWRAVSDWLVREWPFESVLYAPRR